MTISNFGELKTAVAAWGDRSDLTAVIPDFVRMAHDTIVGQVVIGASLTLTTNTVAVPDDFRQVSSIWLDRMPRRPMVMASEYQMQSDSNGVPAYYRVDGSDIVVTPNPNDTYTGKILYKIATTFFATDDATNVILTKYPFVYLWGSLAEMAAYLQDVQMALGYGQKFTAEIERINAVERGDVMDGPLQMSPSSSYGVTP